MAAVQIMESQFLAPGLGNAGVASVAFCVAIATGVAVTWLFSGAGETGRFNTGTCVSWSTVGLNHEDKKN